MKRLRRIVFDWLAVVSALLCVATCVLWVRSYWYVSYRDSQHFWNTDGRGHRDESWATSYRGGLCYAQCRLWIDDAELSQLFRSSQHSKWFDIKGAITDPRTKQKQFASSGFVKRTYGGFGYSPHNPYPGMKGVGWAFAVPYWGAAVLFALPFAGWLLAFRRARRAAWRLRHARCFHCGYDLRASPDRCPECGCTTEHQPAQRESEIGSVVQSLL